MKVSIVIPVYNESHTLRQMLECVRLARLPDGCTKEIVVVDDGSTDGSPEILRYYACAGLIRGLRLPTNSGKGTALRAGFAVASGDIILTQDGDLECDPGDYAHVLEPVVSGEADVVYGSRFLGSRPEMPLMRRIANWVLTTTANLLYCAHLTDEATAYKAFRASVLRQLDLKCKRFEFCPEVTAGLLRLGYRIREVPIKYQGRDIAEGKKIRARDGAEAFWTMIRCRLVPLHILTGDERCRGALPPLMS